MDGSEIERAEPDVVLPGVLPPMGIRYMMVSLVTARLIAIGRNGSHGFSRSPGIAQLSRRGTAWRAWTSSII